MKIVYCSNTGHTKHYAKILEIEMGVKAYSIKEAKEKVQAGEKIIFLGWIMAGVIKGFKKANRCYQIKCVIGVGFSENEQQIENVKKVNHIDDHLLVHTIQGGYELSKLKGLNHFLMKLIGKKVVQELEGKKDKTKEEEKALEMMKYGKDYVSRENLVNVMEDLKNMGLME